MKIKVELLIIILLIIIILLVYLKGNGNLANANSNSKTSNSILKSNQLSTSSSIDAEAYIQILIDKSAAAGNIGFIDNRKPNLFNKITYTGTTITSVTSINYAWFVNQNTTTFPSDRDAMKSSFLKYELDIALKSLYNEDTVDQEYLQLGADMGGIFMSLNNDNIGVPKLFITYTNKETNDLSLSFNTQSTQDNQIVWKIHPDIDDVTDMYGVSKDNKLYLGKIHIGDSLDQTVTWDLVAETFNSNTTTFKYIYNDIDPGVIHVVGVDGNIYSFNTYVDIINQKEGNIVVDTGDIISLYRAPISPELFIVKTDRKLWYVERYDDYFSGNETPRCIADYILNQNLVKPIYSYDNDPPIPDNIVMFEMVAYYTQGSIYCISQDFSNLYNYILYIE